MLSSAELKVAMSYEEDSISSDESLSPSNHRGEKSPRENRLMQGFERYWGKFHVFRGLQDDSWNFHKIGSQPENRKYLFQYPDEPKYTDGYWRGVLNDINYPVMIISSVLIIFLIALAASMPELAQEFYKPAKEWMCDVFGFIVISMINIHTLTLMYLLYRFGDKVLDHNPRRAPRMSYRSWAVVLLSSGMGSGCVFYGMYQPVALFTDPPVSYVTNQTERFGQAISIMTFDWGLGMWARVCSMGLAMTYFNGVHGLPVGLRSCLYPLLGKYTVSWPGHIVDVISVLVTTICLASNTVFTALQISGFLHYTIPAIDNSVLTHCMVALIIIGVSIISVLTGIDKGIKYLSYASTICAVVLVTTMTFCNDPNVSYRGSTQQIFDVHIENIGRCIGQILYRCTRTGAFDVHEKAWLHTWSLYNLLWNGSTCICSATFIAHISRGRTIKEFILTIVILPQFFQFIWFNVFGTTAMNMAQIDPSLADLAPEVLVPTVYGMLTKRGVYGIATEYFFHIMTALCSTLFVVTYIDSGTYVISSFCSKRYPSVPMRVFWGCLELGFSIMFLVTGGMEAINAWLIFGGLLVIAIYLSVLIGLVKTLKSEDAILVKHVPSSEVKSSPSISPIALSGRGQDGSCSCIRSPYAANEEIQ